jgi:serine-type D-Ala-D-Ala carboxypeptidase (penicillin-binding protein 5/6)
MRRRWLGASLVVLALVTAAVLVQAPLRAATPPPTPVGPSGSPSPFPTVLHTPKDALPVPSISAPSAVLEDLDTGQLLFAKAADDARPIASVTKIMTALLVRERLPLSSTVTVSARATSEPGATLGLRVGERMRARDLLTGMLMASADDAAVAFAERIGGSVGGFVDLMNRRARQLGMRNTRYASPDGYSNAGVSTATDLAKLTRVAMRDPVFEAIVRAKRASVRSRNGPLRVVQNRNVLLWLYRGAIGVKTGFTTPAGHCVVAAAERGGVRLEAVVLGAPSDAFSDAAALLDHGFAAFRRATVVASGERLGTLRVGGQPVPVVTGAALVALVPVGAAGRVRLHLREVAGLARPVAPGERVGTLTAVAGPFQLGSVPAVAGAVPSTNGGAPYRRARRWRTPIQAAFGVLRDLVGSVFGPFL